jgi:hypothetical protein
MTFYNKIEIPEKLAQEMNMYLTHIFKTQTITKQWLGRIKIKLTEMATPYIKEKFKVIIEYKDEMIGVEIIKG